MNLVWIFVLILLIGVGAYICWRANTNYNTLDIHFVPEDEVEEVLESLDIEMPKYCTICKDPVYASNLGTIIFDDEEIVVTCRKDECMFSAKQTT